VGLTVVDDNLIWPTVSLKSLAYKPLGRSKITRLAEPELDRSAAAVHRAIEVRPIPADPDVRLVYVPLSSDGPLAQIELLEQLGRVAHDPSMNGRMTDRDTALCHHIFQISQAQTVGQVAPHAQQDDLEIEMASVEHLQPPKLAGGID